MVAYILLEKHFASLRLIKQSLKLLYTYCLGKHTELTIQCLHFTLYKTMHKMAIEYRDILFFRTNKLKKKFNNMLTFETFIFKSTKLFYNMLAFKSFIFVST